MATFRDPLFASQWHFRLLGDIARIWDEYSGAGVTVGVYDDGVQYDHPDLDDNYDATLHFYDPYPIRLTPWIDNDGNPRDADAHGTSVSGLIAGAAGNGIGGVGVAWGATLTGVNLLEDPTIRTDFDVELAAFRHASSFDIMSNSWGYGAFFGDFLNRNDPGSVGAQTVAAFGHAVDMGRDGLGTIIVKSAGNDATNANGEGINGSRYVVNVAALTQTGAITSYSNYGTNILVSAGAASVTTDLTGPNGYGAGDYTNTFGGTSASAPVVSGVVALMLEANDNLGWRDVREILATSAALTGSGLGAAAGFEVEGFTTQGSGNWNGGGRAISRDYGFGRVDAFAAVRMAEAWTLWTDIPQGSNNEAELTASTPEGYSAYLYNLSHPEQSTAVTVSEHFRIEHVDVTVSFSFPALDIDVGHYIEFHLVAPDGTNFTFFKSSEAADFDTGIWDASGGMTWTFGIAHALGLDAFGDWTLFVRGTANGGNVGIITDLTLDFYGALPDFGSDDVHHITKDFLTVTGAGTANWNGGRDRDLVDANGGEDWINLASIAGNVDVTLAQSGSIRVGGALWATLDGNQFENVVTGDGADRVAGNAVANALHGMRGNDVLQGLDGADTLDGGAGNDRLLGGLADDVLHGGTGSNDLFGGVGDDTLDGEAGSGMLRGEAGNDIIMGGSGADWLDGGTGDDTLTGSGGNDRMTGGSGADTFIFAEGFGHDRIMDFTDDTDTLSFATTLWGGITDAQVFVNVYAQIMRGGVLFDFGLDGSVQVNGVTSLAALYNDVVMG